mgnify:CR=1 FL=1
MTAAGAGGAARLPVATRGGVGEAGLRVRRVPGAEASAALSDTTAETDRSSEDDIGLSPDFVRNVVRRIDAGDAGAVRAAAEELHPADLAELLELLRPDERRTLVAILGPELRIAALSELDAGRGSGLSRPGPSC